ncbi:amidohydrolase/deacetylase family metallohydrolase [Dactylosporangium fulvum]|uniref:Amidohydrolase/deacetylase family metallohydrolase n=1 Tax=Dactylosporangium fulvum TaxID=53359 RepID=A0ABY5WCE2_9ACTN|nr:amidohydrolase/deacetylase family metallohydrolase [Dactylosporangium fulvum]UWP86931.1 amidohydrolase/deacetylase family metallohydrolase [Dactylosporangium fulvum]
MNSEGFVLRGGLVCDPEAGSLAPGDVVVRDGRIAAPATAGAADRIVDVSGLVVTPGLVDLHTHVFVGQDLGVDPDVVGPPSGVTTMVDTGSAGAHLFGAFVRGTVERARTRIAAFINISSVGTTSILLSGELKTLAYVDPASCRAAIDAYRDRIVGVKVRASADVAGDNGVVALDRAREVADAEGLPLMVHLGPPPASLADILARLGPGDILTHCFTGLSGTPFTEHGRLVDLIAEARRRGVVFDIGHGMCGFDLEQARAAVAAGFLPDTISSDLHTYSRDIVGGLPDVMAKFLALGVGLPEVVRRTTIVPARVAGLDGAGVGSLRPGAPADLAVLRVTDGPSPTVSAALTVRNGEIVHSASN